MKKIIFILSILLCLKTFAERPLFKNGNNEYKNGNYSVAISIYDSIIFSGSESSELYYNLGNCYYKTQDWANAIWHYEKSLNIEKDIKTLQNLNLSRLQIIDKIEPLPKIFYKIWWDILVSKFNTKSWQILSLLSVWLALIIQLLYIFTRYKRNYFSTFLNSLIVILLFLTYSSYNENHSKEEAIIFTSSVSVNSAPTVSSKNLFFLHSGTKITIIDKVENWINIEIADKKNGWIQESDCRILQ